jgi:hypothetical protein
MPYSSETARRFGGTHGLHLQGQKVSQARNQLRLLPDSAGLLFGLLIKTEDRGDLFLRNVGLSQKYYSVAVVRKRTIPTERPPLVGEVTANLCG